MVDGLTSSRAAAFGILPSQILIAISIASRSTIAKGRIVACVVGICVDTVDVAAIMAEVCDAGAALRAARGWLSGAGKCEGSTS